MANYVCKVERNIDTNEILLVNKNEKLDAKTTPGGLKFDNEEDLNKYFKEHCISDDKIHKSASNFYTFLFLIFLLLVAVIYMKSQTVKNPVVSSTGINPSSFGSFSF